MFILIVVYKNCRISYGYKNSLICLLMGFVFTIKLLLNLVLIKKKKERKKEKKRSLTLSKRKERNIYTTYI